MKKYRLFNIVLVAILLFFCPEVFGQPGMMHRGYNYGGSGQTFQPPIKMEQAKEFVQNYMDELGNPNLKQGKIEDKGNVFIADIVTKEGSLVDQLKINKNTGWIYNRYGLAPGMRERRHGSGSQSDWNYCPYCGRGLHYRGDYGGMDSPMMHHGPGMMGQGYGFHHGRRQSQNPIDLDTVKDFLKDYLKSLRNPNLKIGDIKEKDKVFEAEVVTKKKEDLVDIVSVNKYTGWMQSIY